MRIRNNRNGPNDLSYTLFRQKNAERRLHLTTVHLTTVPL